MFRRRRQIVEILGIVDTVVKFVDGTSRSCKVPLWSGHGFFVGETIKLVSNLSLVGPGRRLVVTEVRTKIANVEKAVIADRTGRVDCFIDPVPMSEHIVARRGICRSQKRFSLHHLRNLHICHAKHSRSEIDETDQSVEPCLEPLAAAVEDAAVKVRRAVRLALASLDLA